MIKHTNFQIIKQNGKPAFVVIPYNQFFKIRRRFAKPYNAKRYIPNEVVGIMVKAEVSRIRAWREYLGFTQQEIADKMGISQAALSQIEAKDSKPRKATLLKLAAIYGLTVAQLR